MTQAPKPPAGNAGSPPIGRPAPDLSPAAPAVPAGVTPDAWLRLVVADRGWAVTARFAVLGLLHDHARALALAAGGGSSGWALASAFLGG